MGGAESAALELRGSLLEDAALIVEQCGDPAFRLLLDADERLAHGV
jgi:hypothetical protein